MLPHRPGSQASASQLLRFVSPETLFYCSESARPTHPMRTTSRRRRSLPEIKFHPLHASLRNQRPRVEPGPSWDLHRSHVGMCNGWRRLPPGKVHYSALTPSRACMPSHVSFMAICPICSSALCSQSSAIGTSPVCRQLRGKHGAHICPLGCAHHRCVY